MSLKLISSVAALVAVAGGLAWLFFRDAQPDGDHVTTTVLTRINTEYHDL